VKSVRDLYSEHRLAAVHRRQGISASTQLTYGPRVDAATNSLPAGRASHAAPKTHGLPGMACFSGDYAVRITEEETACSRRLKVCQSFFYGRYIRCLHAAARHAHRLAVLSQKQLPAARTSFFVATGSNSDCCRNPWPRGNCTATSRSERELESSPFGAPAAPQARKPFRRHPHYCEDVDTPIPRNPLPSKMHFSESDKRSSSVETGNVASDIAMPACAPSRKAIYNELQWSTVDYTTASFYISKKSKRYKLFVKRS